MEKFIIGENRNESLFTELIHRTEVFMNDSRRILAMDILSVDLIKKMMNTIATFKEVLENVTPKSDEEIVQIKSVLQDLNDLEKTCMQRKTLQ